MCPWRCLRRSPSAEQPETKSQPCRKKYVCMYVCMYYGQASGQCLAVPAPPPPQWYGLPAVWGGGGWRVANSQALRKQTVNPITQSVPLFRETLICTSSLTPNPKPHLTAGSKPKAEHTPQILPKPLVDSKPYTL